MKDNEETRYAKSMYAEYLRLNKRANYPGIPAIEQEYTSRMANNVKSRIDFKLLKPQKKTIVEKENYSYEEY